MDFLTAAAYIAILLLAPANAILVRRIRIEIRDDDGD